MTFLDASTSIFIHLDLSDVEVLFFQVAVRWVFLSQARCVFLGPIGEYDFVKIVKAAPADADSPESPNITGRVRQK